ININLNININLDIDFNVDKKFKKRKINFQFVGEDFGYNCTKERVWTDYVEIKAAEDSSVL
uniref:Uncharacterized protein n=1 Tax=Romanomermis culicivorax TaxID=13658 RepID=A0A915I2B2_ROMCU